MMVDFKFDALYRYVSLHRELPEVELVKKLPEVCIGWSSTCQPYIESATALSDGAILHFSYKCLANSLIIHEIAAVILSLYSSTSNYGTLKKVPQVEKSSTVFFQKRKRLCSVFRTTLYEYF